jgi:hypothetical protein
MPRVAIDKLALEHGEIERAFNGCLSVPVVASQSSSRAGKRHFELEFRASRTNSK